ARPQVLLHSHQKLPYDSPGGLRVLALKGVEDLVLMFEAFDDGLEDAFTIIGTANQIHGIERNHDAFERLPHKTISGHLPNLVSETQVRFEESLEIFGFRFQPGLFY